MTAEEIAEHAPAYRRRKDQRPDEILAAGLEEFNEHGFAGASMARIAKRADVSRGTLYLYFENKEALFLAVAENAMSAFTRDAAAKMDMGDHSTEETLRALFGQMYAMMTSTKNSALLRILVSEGPNMPDLVAQYHARILSTGKQLLARIIARGVERSEVREDAAGTVPQLLIAPVMFYVIHTMVFGDLEPLDENQFAQSHLDMIMRGIGQPPCQGGPGSQGPGQPADT
ncbi:MAG: TetR/AcrR family transcriptional regulator [Pseudomonadota bacterium]